MNPARGTHGMRGTGRVEVVAVPSESVTTMSRDVGPPPPVVDETERLFTATVGLFKTSAIPEVALQSAFTCGAPPLPLPSGSVPSR